MKILEDFHRQQLEAIPREKRTLVILSATVLCLHFIKIKFEKVSVGGSEIVISEPYAVTGLLGIVIIYICLRVARKYFAVLWAQDTLEPEWRELQKKSRGTYLMFQALDVLLGLFEGGLILLAIVIAWPDTLKLVSEAIQRAFA